MKTLLTYVYRAICGDEVKTSRTFDGDEAAARQSLANRFDHSATPLLRVVSATSDDTVKYGPKGRHALILKGWHRVEDAHREDVYCKPGDRFLNLQHGTWDLAEDDDIGMLASDFDYLIRKDVDTEA